MLTLRGWDEVGGKEGAGNCALCPQSCEDRADGLLAAQCRLVVGALDEQKLASGAGTGHGENQLLLANKIRGQRLHGADVVAGLEARQSEESDKDASAQQPLAQEAPALGLPEVERLPRGMQHPARSPCFASTVEAGKPQPDSRERRRRW